MKLVFNYIKNISFSWFSILLVIVAFCKFQTVVP